MFQGIAIALLVIFALIADMFKKDIGAPFSSTDVINITMLMTSLFIVMIIGLISSMMYFQEKKSDTFLKHRLWDKMYIIMPIIIFISLVIVFILFLTGPLSDLTQINRWIIYVLIYYFLFLINLTVLAVIHKMKKNTMSNESKISSSFIWTAVGFLVVIFIL